MKTFSFTIPGGRWLTLTLVVAMANFAAADQTFRVGDGPVQVSMTLSDGGVSSTTSAVSDWIISTGAKELLLHWTATPFTHGEHDGIRTNTSLVAVVTRESGLLRVSPSQSRDQTNLAGGDDTASVTMGIRGSGRARIQLQVGIDDQHAVAGRHHATVVLTVSAP